MNQPAKPQPLGRGLSALFGDADTSFAAPRPVAPAPVGDVKAGGNTLMPITWLQPGAFQPRRHFDEAALVSLADSVKERGILEPLIVRAIPTIKDGYEIIAGERRWRAAQMAGLHNVPVLVRTLSDREALEFGLIENVQRQDLSPLEEAEGYKRLLEEFDHTQDNLGKIVGKSRAHISNMLRLLTLPLAVKQMIDKGELTLGHARTVITAKDPLGLAQQIVKKGMSVRQAEALAKRELEANSPENKVKAKNKEASDFAIQSLEKDLTRAIGFKVSIKKTGARSGLLSVEYHDHDQLTVIMRRLTEKS